MYRILALAFLTLFVLLLSGSSYALLANNQVPPTNLGLTTIPVQGLAAKQSSKGS